MAIVCVLSVDFFYILGTHFGIPSSGSIGIILAIMFFAIGLIKGQKLSLNNYPYLLLINILALVVATNFFVSYSTMTFPKLMGFSILPMLLVFCKYDYKKVVRYACALTPLVFVVHGYLFVLQGTFNQMEMGYSYAIVHILAANLIQWFYFRKESGFYLKACNLISFYFLVRVLMAATRGTIVSIAFIIFLIWLIRFDENGNYIKLTKKKKIQIFFIFVAAVIVYINLEPVLKFFENMFESVFGTVPAAVKKTLDAIESNDLSHGRDDLTEFTLSAIKDSPAFGHGVLTFNHFNDYVYPHNCILQLLFEGGIIGAALQIICIIYGFYDMIFHVQNNGKEKTCSNVIIFITAFPMLLFSNETWKTPAFWIFMIIGARSLKIAFSNKMLKNK